MSEMLTIKGGKYVQVTGVVVIVNDSTDNTSNNSNKAMVNVGTSKSDGNNSKDTIDLGDSGDVSILCVLFTPSISCVYSLSRLIPELRRYRPDKTPLPEYKTKSNPRQLSLKLIR